MSNLAIAKMHEFETTHTKSIAGTGVAGIYMEEAAFLNPASLAFFEQGDIYVQRDMMQIKDKDGNIIQKPKNTGVVLADGNPSLSGSLSYVQQEEGDLKRSRWGVSASAPLNKQSAFGVSFRKTKDENLTSKTESDYYQTVYGMRFIASVSANISAIIF